MIISTTQNDTTCLRLLVLRIFYVVSSCNVRLVVQTLVGQTLAMYKLSLSLDKLFSRSEENIREQPQHTLGNSRSNISLSFGESGCSTSSSSTTTTSERIS